MLEQLESLTPLGDDYPAPSLLEDSTSLAEEGAQPISYFASTSRNAPASASTSGRAPFIPAGPLGVRLRNARSARHLLTMIIDYSTAFTKVDLTIACTCLQNLLASRANTNPRGRRLPPALAAPDDLIVDAIQAIFQAATALLPTLAAEELLPVLRLGRAAPHHLPDEPSVTLPAFLTPLEPHLPTHHPDVVALFLYIVADTRCHLPPPSTPASPTAPARAARTPPEASTPLKSDPDFASHGSSAPPPAPPATHVPTSFIEACIAALQPEKLHQLQPFRTASILWSLGALQHTPSPQWLEAYLQAAVAHIQAFNAQNLQALLWGISSSGAQSLPEEWAAALADHLVTLLPSCDAQTVCTCLKSLAKLNTPVKPATQTAILNYLAGNMALIPPHILAKTTWQIAHLNFQPSTAWLKTFYYTTYPLFQRLPTAASTSPTPSTSPARDSTPSRPRRRRGTASKYDSTPSSDAEPSLDSPTAAPAATPPHFNLKDIANVLTALRLWQLRPPAKWLARCYAAATPALPTAPPLATTLLICEAAVIDPQPPDSFLHATAAALSTPAFAADGRLLNKALVSLVRFEGFALSPDTRQVFFANTQDHLHKWRPVDLLQIFSSIANLGLHAPPAWTRTAITHIASTITADPATTPQTLYLTLVQLARMQPPTESLLATPDNAPPTSAVRSVLLTFPAQSPTAPLPPANPSSSSTTSSQAANTTITSSSYSSSGGDDLHGPPALLLTPIARVVAELPDLRGWQTGVLLTVCCKLHVQLTWELLDALGQDLLRTEFHFHLMLLQQVCGMPTAPSLRRWRLFFRDAVNERLFWGVFGLPWKVRVLEAVARWGWAPSEEFVEDVISASVVDLVAGDQEDADRLREVAEALGFEVGAEWEEAYESAYAYGVGVPAFVTG